MLEKHEETLRNATKTPAGPRKRPKNIQHAILEINLYLGLLGLIFPCVSGLRGTSRNVEGRRGTPGGNVEERRGTSRDSPIHHQIF